MRHIFGLFLRRGAVLGLVVWLSARAFAAPFTLVQDPAGTGVYSALVNDSFAATGVANADDWSFEGEVGDRISVRLEAAVGNSRPRVRLLNTSNTVLFSSDGGTDGFGLMSTYVITTPGTYRVRVYTDHAVSAYSMRFDLARNLDLEVESNDTLATANVLVPTLGSGSFSFAVAGLAPSTDTVGDTFAIGIIPTGSTVNTTIQLPTSSLTASDVSLKIFERRTADRSLDFTGSTYATIPHNAAFDAIETANALTLEAWIYIGSFPSGYFPIFDKYNTTGDWGWVFEIQNGGGGISFWDRANVRATSEVTPSLNSWHHVAVSYDHAANTVRFYLNGALVATKASPGVLTNTTSDPAYVGFSPSGSDMYADGAISELRLWNRSLTTTEIQANYAAANLLGSESGLVGLWRFDEGTGTSSVDASASGNHAILGGGNPVRVPAWSTGSIRQTASVNGTALNRAMPAEAYTWFQFSAAANRGLSARYLLTGTVTDTVNLHVASTTFPTAGGSTSDFIQSFSVTFDDELNPSAANTLSNFDLRSSGVDGVFGNADDNIYILGSPNYINGATLTFPILNAPLQPGNHRLTIGVGLRDRAGNPLDGTFTRDFTAAVFAGYRIENQSNDTFATATTLSASGNVGAGYGGAWRDGVNFPSAGDAPMGIATADFDNDGKLDLVTANFSSGTISMLKGNGDGTFGAATTYAAPNQPFQLMVGDLNGDNRPDVVVTRRYGSAVRVFLNLNDGTGAFAPGVDYATAAGPHWLVLRDLNNDGRLDVATANYDASSVSVLYNSGTGTFAPAATFPVTGNPHGISAGDVNGDGLVDIVVGTLSDRSVKVYLRLVGGAYVVADVFVLGPSYGGASIAVGDLNGDGRADILAAPEYGSDLRRWHQTAGGTLLEATPLPKGGNAYGYSLTLADINGDGLLDVLSGANSYIYVFENLGGGVFSSPVYPSVATEARNVVTGDFNGDGRVDIASSAQGSDAVRVFLGRGPEILPADGATAFLGRGRGTIRTDSDLDYYSFSAKAGDRVIVGSENPNQPAATGQQFRVYRAEGGQIASFESYNGSGQTQFVAPISGIYYVRAQQYYGYYGEYRFAVSVTSGSFDLESEANNTSGAADPLVWTATAGSQSAAVAGVLSYGDVGDWFALGYLDVGTQLTLGASKPASSSLVWILDVLDASSVQVISEVANAPSLNYTIPANKAGVYYARIRADSGADLFAQYRLALTLADTQKPTILAATLPTEGSVVSDFFNDFTLSFSETMQATTVNNIANYDLRAAGPDGIFGTADDLPYTIAPNPSYTSGLNANFRVTDGPLQPGLYRFQAKTGLLDLYSNAMLNVYSRTFSIVGVANFVFESRSNNTFATATTLAAAGSEGAGYGGAWRDGIEYATSGGAPMGIGTADFDNDGKLDLVAANYNGGTISILKGNGDGTFGTATTYAAPNQPFQVMVGDLNGDNRPDVVVTRRYGAAVRVFLNLNNGTGAMAAGVDYTTGTGPHWLALRDLNGDGKLDIVTANHDNNSVSILYNSGTGTFAPAVNVPVSGNPHGIATGDVNGDGLIDFVVGTLSDRSVKVYHRQADGSYLAGSVFVLGPSYGGTSIAVGDVNGDGRADILAAPEYGTEIRRWHQEAGGTLVEGTPLNKGGNAYGYSVTLADLNGDGRLDVISGANSYIYVFENQGSGVFGSPHYPYVAREARNVVAGDFNGDGRVDLASSAQQGDAVSVFLARGPETLAADGPNGVLARARGNISSDSDLDYFSFSAKIGDRVIVGSENPNHAAATGQQFRVYRAEGGQITSFESYNGSGQTQFVAPISGIYYVRAQQYYGYYGEYRFAVSVMPGAFDLESEANNSASAADVVAWTQLAGSQTASMAGVVSFADPGDWFYLGFLDVGTDLTVNATKPPSSGLTWILDLLDSNSSVVTSVAPGVGTLAHTVQANKAGNYYARIRASAGDDLFAQYRLTFGLGDSKKPTIVGDTLPAQNSTRTDFFGDFQLTFSETLQAASVQNLANYDLRAAGPDASFDTADDVVYSTVLAATYTTGLSASYRVTDNPLQPGLYRFQAKVGLVDLYANPLDGVYTRNFTISAVPNYVLESRSNETFATATSLGTGGEGAGPGGSWRDGVNYASGGVSPYGVATGDFNNDGKLDLVSANWTGGTIGVMLGNGDGTFGTAVTYAAPNNPFKVIAGDLNGDGRPDLVVTRRNGGAVRVFLNLNDGTGAFAPGVDYTTGTGPHWVALRDLNGDGSIDMVTANYNANTLSIFYNNGNGTFAAAVSLPVAGGPHGISAGDLNNDGRIDLAVGTYGDKSIKIFYRQVDGTYAPGDVYVWGPTYGTTVVTIADLNGDNRADLIAAPEYGSEIRRWYQQANGTLVESTPLNHGGNVYGYSLLVADLDGDGDREIIAGRNGYITVFENLGSNTFASPAYPNVGQDARDVVAGDFNSDGRMDLAASSDGANALRVFLGRGPEVLATDGPGKIGRGRGQISIGTDVDNYSFSAKAGDRVLVASETPGNAAATGQQFRVYRPEGDQVISFESYNGSGQNQFIAPVSGIYYLRVQQYYGYYGEYRFSVAVVPGTFGLESEVNNSAGAADPIAWTQSAGSQTATIAGLITFGDTGDWFGLGALADGTQITLTATKPPSSTLVWILDILNPSSTVVATGAAGAPSLTYTVPGGTPGAYYARVRSSTNGDLLAQYHLALTLADTQPPYVVANSFPAQGSTTTSLIDRLTLTFSEDMQPSTVNNLANYDLRSAGVDGTFDTTDDVVIPLIMAATYSSGLEADIRTASGGPLPVGSYRFKALAGLADEYGNTLSPIHTRIFSVESISVYAAETESNNTLATATVIPLQTSQPDLYGTGGRGYLQDNNDVDFWSFNLQAGDRVLVQGEIPGSPAASGLTYQLFNPAGTLLGSLSAAYTGAFSFPAFTATQSGLHSLRVSVYYGYNSEYRFRVYVMRGDLQVEVEANDTIATANPVALVLNGTNARGSIAGLSRVAGDLDYFNLGSLQAGTTAFLSTRQPTGSTFVPVVSLYTPSGILVAESVGGRAGDAVAQVTLSTTGVYYALVRTSGSTSGLDSEYVLDVLVVPTVDISFPNLQATSLTAPPATGLKSGNATTVSFRVDNLGNLATAAVTWVDRVVLSIDTIYGNDDDIELGVFSHSGPLNATSSYNVTGAAVTIPHGISGSYYVIVRTDHTNTISEFVLEGDNETVSDAPIAITLADYPDLVVETLAVSEADGAGTRTATWTLANRGVGSAAAGFSERFVVRNNSTGTTLVTTVTPVASVLAANGTLARQATFTTLTAGNYTVEVTADSLNTQYEFNASGNVAAEINNVASVPFSIVQLYTITVAADPVVGGSVTGGGTFTEGSNRTVTATPNAPYVFAGWFEGAFLRSVSVSYTAPLNSNRNLTARFAYPTFVIGTQVNPAGTGVVTGGGVYSLGANVTLTASALPGYLFSKWSDGATDLGTVSPILLVASADRTVVANFIEANPTHVVTTASLPAGITTVTGAGTYNNGQTATIATDAVVTSGETEYVFVRYLLNGSPVGTAPSILKTFTTLDGGVFNYVAEYKVQAVKPTVAQVTTNFGNVVGITSTFQITIRFDRAMDQTVKPVVELISSNASTVPTVSANGAWVTSDTYVTPAITVAANHGGDYSVRVSVARDTSSRVMTTASVYNFKIDVVAPELPVVTKGPVTATTAVVEWNGYTAPADLASFRIYRSSSAFTSLDGLSPIGSVGAAARTSTLTGLAIDTDYFVAVVPVDSVGNAPTTVTSLLVRVSSTIPPAVNFDVAAISTNAARLTWTFDTAGLIGFKGFKIYRHSAAFTSLAGLTPIATLGQAVRTYDNTGLDRALTHHYVVVAENLLGETVTAVVSKPWTDPLSGTLATNFTASDPVLIITQPLTITGNATFTVPAGTVVAFGPGASITVQSGRLIADGTIFAPIIFTSLADLDNASPTRGSWNGIILADAAQASTLRNVWIKYGQGLSITAGAHTVDTLGAAWNSVGALRLAGSVSLTTQSAYFSNNAVGASTASSASLTLSGSVLRNNDLNATAAAGSALNATGNWWGSADAGVIAGTVSGPVVTTNPLAGEPILTRGFRPTDGATSTGVANLPVQVASLNATGYRISEDSSFAGVLFVDVPRNPLSTDLFNTALWPVVVPLSPGGGTKTLYAQFRSPTGSVSSTISFTTNYITTGPVISAFSLTEGLTLNRPVTATGSATSALPLVSLTFSVDDVTIATSTTTSLSALWDIRLLTPGVHRVRLSALDAAGNLASRSLNVVINPNPPPRPVLTAPLDGSSTTVNNGTVSGTAESLANIRIYRNGTVVATVIANAAGAFTAPNVQFVEGTNELSSSAYDNIGNTASTSVFINVDSGPPAPVTLLPIAYNVGEGVFIDWDLPTSGEVPVLYRVFYHNAPFTSLSEATGQSDATLRTYAVLNNVPDGMRYFAVVGYDDAGNASVISNVRSFNVDLTPPSFAIAYNQSMPVGPGTLGITVTASEPLSATPVLLMRPAGGGLLAVTLTPAGGNNYTVSFPVTSLSATSGLANIGITGTDIAGNSFTGPPSGTPVVFDVTKPTGILSTSQASPIKTTTNVTLSISLLLSELPKVGTTPTLTFSPPSGALVPVVLAGSGLSWSGQVTLTPAMDNGNGTFLLNVTDVVGNVGTVLTAGERLEIYNTATPTPAAVPAGIAVLPMKGGVIRVSWSAADKAHSYRLYREAGASAAVPTTLVTSDITALTIDDLPPADGAYRYVVTSFRLGAESGPSGVRATTSDRTPPPAPTVTAAVLGATGINVSWTPASSGEIPAKWVIHRNGVVITTINNSAITSYVDSPGRGVMNYQVAAADVLGNEAPGPIATIELFVGAVGNLRATVDPEVGTKLTWTSSDATTVGYNVYRNGIKQNPAALTALTFTDAFPAGGQPVTYSVTATNAAAQQSAARTLVVQPFTAVVKLNENTAGEQSSAARYFDSYSLAMTVGSAASAPVGFANGEIVRAVTGDTTVQVSFPLPSSIAAGETKTATAVMAAPNLPGVIQGTAISLATTPDAGGSQVIYRLLKDFQAGSASGLMMTVSANEPPLAGGAAELNVTVYNRGFAAADLVVSRVGNTQPGDLEMQIINAEGVLVSSTPFVGSLTGTIINPQGDAFLRVEPGASVNIPFSGIVVPDSLTGQAVTFRARFKTIYNALRSTEQRVAGPLDGSMASSLRVTPYFATATTAQPAFSDNQPVVISGFSINRTTGQPMPNVPIRVGIRVRGAVIYKDILTDGTGAYSYSYTPSLGLAGELVIWAAHPDIVDQLNQARVSFYRLFTNPGRIEAVMSKNDTLDFDVALLNPGDIALTNPAVSFRAYRMNGTTEVPITTLTGTARTALPTTLAPLAQPKVNLRLQAALDVPDDALFEFIFTTTEGASTTLSGTISFRPALAVLTTVSPTVGYAEAGLGRGQIKSVEVTIQNRGLRSLTGVKMTPPATVPWMQVNLPTDSAGVISLPDIPIGGTRTFSVIFAPPDTAAVGFYNDFLLIKGDNAVADYRLNLFATVTSELKGAVQFDITNTFSNPVPNASIWLRNTTLGTEIGPVLTDINGRVIVPNLMEGDWQWKTQAAGHSAAQGIVQVVPDQTVGVQVEVVIGMVSVKFSVVPVPFTDYYEIKIEQTFQTRTPIPNLIMSPPHQTLQVEAGWSGTLIYTLRNEGLRSLFDVNVTGGDMPTMRATPLISFIPEIKAGETIQVPMFFEYFGPAETATAGGSSVAPGVSITADGTDVGGKSSVGSPARAASAKSGGTGSSPAKAAGVIDEIYDCYKEIKYGTITLKAAAFIDSVSGARYTVGVNATIDVDELLALVCDGECPERWTGGGVAGKVGNWACGKIVGKIVEQIGKKTKVIDIICKASNIIKALACAAAQLPTGTLTGGGPGGGGSGGGWWGGGNIGGGWSIGGAGCFVAGTPITLADGSTIPIEQIAQGSRLLASSGRVDTVAQVQFLSSDHVRQLSFKTRLMANASTTNLQLTHDHRVWVDGRGWVFAADVKVGDWLHGADGQMREVTANVRLEGRHDVYGLHMGIDNVIYAGGVLTEDQCFKGAPAFLVNPQTGGAK